MIETDHLRKTLEHYRKLRQQQIDEIRPALEKIRGYDSLIRNIAEELNEPANIQPLNIELPALAVAEDVNPVAASPARASVRHTVRPDEFFQMSQNDAAKAYLRMVGQAISMDELVRALQAGGAKLGGADPKRTLYVSLKANPKKEFVWPSKDHIGLPEFYQGRK
jgi:hypothetical protein